MKASKQIKKENLWRIAAVLFWLFAWQGAALLLHSFLLSSPLQVVKRLAELLQDGSYYAALRFSFLRIAGGFCLGTLVGGLLAVAAARCRPVESLLRPVMLTVKSVPVASFIIVALIWLNSRRLNTFISFLMVLPIVYGNLLEGLKSESRALAEMARVYQVSPLRRLVYVQLPQLKPYLLSALSLALGMSWKSGIAAEVIGIPTGSTGAMLYQAKVYLDMSALYAWTVSIVLVSLAFEKAVLFLVKRAFARLERL